MIPYLLISNDIPKRLKEAEKILLENNFSRNHPDLLWFGEEEKLGIEQARKLQQFLSLKPYQSEGLAVVVVAAENFTIEAQNALLKTLEEPPGNCLFILGVSSEDQLLSTILSRCQAIYFDHTPPSDDLSLQCQDKIEKLLCMTTEQRFGYIEKLADRDLLLKNLILFFRHELIKKSLGVNTNPPPRCTQKQTHRFLKELMEAERWARQNVNIRAILEYLMLKMPNLD